MAKKKPGPEPGTGGRPRKEITQREVDNLCAIQCTMDEIAAYFGCHRDTIRNRVRDWTGDSEMTFSMYFAQKSVVGKVSLRRRQFRMAHKVPAMAIWLGKQWLDQKDVKEIKADHNIMNIDINLNPEDEKKYERRIAEFFGPVIEENNEE